MRVAFLVFLGVFLFLSSNKMPYNYSIKLVKNYEILCSENINKYFVHLSFMHHLTNIVLSIKLCIRIWIVVIDNKMKNRIELENDFYNNDKRNFPLEFQHKNIHSGGKNDCNYNDICKVFCFIYFFFFYYYLVSILFLFVYFLILVAVLFVISN